ncbi:Protease Do-like 4 [Durusdinium trenchii]|uniref:Mitochondrial n=1 Tax=Durusdinium trenchii TaxID=1381693 RepID=A0ABP0J9M2_9DINO
MLIEVNMVRSHLLGGLLLLSLASLDLKRSETFLTWPMRGKAVGFESGFHRASGMARRVEPKATNSVVDIFGREVGDQGQEDGSHEGQGRKHFVVKVYCMYSSQDPSHPWTNKQQEDRMGSGCVILHEGKMCLLTNAHVVADASYVEVRKAGNAKKFSASRLKIAHECDLALLSAVPKWMSELVTIVARTKKKLERLGP